MRLPPLSRGALTGYCSYQNIQSSIPVKVAGTAAMAVTTHACSFLSQPNPTAFSSVPVSIPILSRTLPTHHQLQPSEFDTNTKSSVSPSPFISLSSATAYQDTQSFISISPVQSAKTSTSPITNMSRPLEPLLIVFDFDGTITEEDTLETLARFAAHYTALNEWKKRPGVTKKWKDAAQKGVDKLSSAGTSFDITPTGIPKPPSTVPMQVALLNPTPEELREAYRTPGLTDVVSSTSPRAIDLIGDWQSSVVEPYFKDLKKFESEYPLPEQSRLKFREAEEYLEAFRPVEEASIKRVEQSSLFEKFIPKDFKRFGKEAVDGSAEYLPNAPCFKLAPRPGQEATEDQLTSVRLRKGFQEFLQQDSFSELTSKYGKRSWIYGIVSVNWSLDFIRGVLGHEDPTSNLGNDPLPPKFCRIKRNPAHEPPDCKYSISHIEGRPGILANRIITPAGQTSVNIAGPPRQDNKLVVGPHKPSKPLTTAGDKAEALAELRNHVGPIGPVVYIGDSKTDLLCLLHADLGIIIANVPEIDTAKDNREDVEKALGKNALIAILKRLGEEVRHVSEVGSAYAKYVWARDFEEIMESKILAEKPWDLQTRF